MYRKLKIRGDVEWCGGNEPRSTLVEEEVAWTVVGQGKEAIAKGGGQAC